MNLEKDFVCDYTLQLFIDTKTCPGIFFPALSTTICRNKHMLTRQFLNVIMWSIIKAQNADRGTVRTIFEDLPAIVKSLTGITQDSELRVFLDQYYEEVLQTFQVVATDSSQSSELEDALQELKQHTVTLISAFRKKLTPPLVLKVFEDHQKRLKKKLEELSTSSESEQDLGHPDECSTALPGHPRTRSHKSVINDATVSTDNSSEEEESGADDEVVINEDDRLSSEEDTPAERVDDAQNSNTETCSSFNHSFNIEIAASDHTSENISTNSDHVGSQRTNKWEAQNGRTADADEDESDHPVRENEDKAGGDDTFESRTTQDATLETDNAEEDPASTSKVFKGVNIGMSPHKERGRQIFTVDIDVMLIHGVKAYGVGSWKTILDHYDFPPYRKPVHLKDRWRTILYKEIISYNKGVINILAEEHAKAFTEFVKKKPSPAISEASVQSIRLKKKRKTKPYELRNRSPACSPSSSRSLRSPKKTALNCPTPSYVSPSHSENEEILTNGDNPISIEHDEPEFRIDDRQNDIPAATEEEPSTSSRAMPNLPEYRPRHKRKRRLWDAEGQSLTWEDPILKPNFDPNTSRRFLSQNNPPKFRRKAWSDWEIKNLRKGLSRYGVGQWSMILDQFKFENRNAVMLKDKYRNMVKNRELPKQFLPANCQ